jgi:hypothetical protein
MDKTDKWFLWKSIGSRILRTDWLKVQNRFYILENTLCSLKDIPLRMLGLLHFNEECQRDIPQRIVRFCLYSTGFLCIWT